MIEFQMFTMGGKMTWQTEELINGVIYTRRVVQQPDGTYWSYNFYENTRHGVGTPCRGKARQPYMLEFIKKVEAVLEM